MEKLIHIIKRVEQTKTPVCVSVGANDGIFVDELYHHNLLKAHWKCYFVEPVKETYEKLQQNMNDLFPNNNFIFENSAIHVDEGKGVLITAIEDDSNGMCSFFRSQTERSKLFQVNKITFKTFLAKHNLKHVDILKVDCEGMDYEIILQALECGLRPVIVLFEDIDLGVNTINIRGRAEFLKEISTYTDFELVQDQAKYQFEESNLLLINKKYV
jgi:FkbM family methyltransferase